jgi:hypothetical protein
MQITLELPEDIAQGPESKWKDLPRAISGRTRRRKKSFVRGGPESGIEYLGSAFLEVISWDVLKSLA